MASILYKLAISESDSYTTSEEIKAKANQYIADWKDISKEFDPKSKEVGKKILGKPHTEASTAFPLGEKKIKLPTDIKTTGKAITWIMGEYDMTSEEAIEWLRKNN